jgi:predicted membrane protein
MRVFRSIAYCFYGLLLFLALVFGYLYTQAEYEAVKKFYPDLTFWDYVILGDKLRITPKLD